MPKMRGFKPEIWTDDKFVELEPLARLLFMGMWNYSCDNGHLDDKPKQIKMRVLPTDECDAAALIQHMIDLGMVRRDTDGLTVPKLRDHQRLDNRYFTWCDRCSLDEIPEPARSKHPAYTSSARREPDVSTTSAPVAPSEGRKEGYEGEGEGRNVSAALTLAKPTRDDVERICEHLADRIEANGAKRPTVTTKWRNEARLMLDRDGRTEAEVIGAIDWSQADSFWRANILSLPKLREKYDQLLLHAQRRPPPGTRQQQTDDLFDRAAQRMGVSR